MANYKFDNINANWSELRNNILKFVDPAKEIHILVHILMVKDMN